MIILELLLLATFVYALVLRIIWRSFPLVSHRGLIIDFSPGAAEAAGKMDASNDQTEPVQWSKLGFQSAGLLGEKENSPGVLLCPLTTLYCYLVPHRLIARCGKSTDQTTLVLVSQMGPPATLVTAFKEDVLLITTVGDAPSVSESDWVKQSAANFDEAWSLHHSTMVAWEENGYLALCDSRQIWAKVENHLSEVIGPLPFQVYEREAYFQKCAFILGGGLVSFGLGVALALWL